MIDIVVFTDFCPAEGGGFFADVEESDVAICECGDEVGFELVHYH